ncbi:hypothetical protein AALM99_07410 [Lactococcus muris]|uniref:Uncharacterized protein n=1 Tax=Lactococcus muris TaxID=2941330 RepID=A0ABV4D937_9LACT
MDENLKSSKHVDVDYLIKVLKLSDDEKNELFDELHHLLNSRGMLEQFLEIAQRTLSAEAFEGLKKLVEQNRSLEHYSSTKK